MALTALDDVLLQASDEDNVVPDVFSRITGKYDHVFFSGGSEINRFRVTGEQAFNRGARIAIGYEVPILDFSGGPGIASGQGLGDIKLSFNAILGKYERFAHAGKVEFTLPSASNDAVGFGQNIVKIAWGFSTLLSSRTVFSGTLAYNKAMTAPSGEKGIHNFEPEAIIAQEISPMVAGYLDWDTYRDFNADRFGQTLKAGLTLKLTHDSRWSASPYTQFPLNHFTSSTNLKNETGIELSYRY